jgi:hypothetical protein
MIENNGGPAFPSDSNQYGPAAGMTLRDYFAAKALSTVQAYSQEDVSTWSPEDFAKHAYALADAMLAARSA